MTALAYDRRVPAPFIAALGPGGPMHELVSLVNGQLGREKGLDLRFRALPDHSGARATLYLGLTQVLHVHWGARGKVRLAAQTGKGFREQLNSSLFDAAWSQPQELASLATDWSKVMTYVRDAVAAAPAKYLSTEGRAQARLARETERFITIDREIVVSFADQATKDAAVSASTAGVQAAKEALATSHDWAVRGKSFGTELDLLAVNPGGRLLVVEVKHGTDTAGVGWTPAQVAVYLNVMRRWAETASDPDAVLNGMLAQYAAVGLPGEGMSVRTPVDQRPVIAIAEPISNRRVANERMVQVVTALSTQGVLLDNLEIWVIDKDGAVSTRGLGEL